MANGIIGTVDVAGTVDQKKPLRLVGHGEDLLQLKVLIIIPQDSMEAKEKKKIY